MEITQISVRGVLYDIVDTKTTINGKTGEIAASDIAAVLNGTEYSLELPEWAKQPNKPTYTAAEVGLGNVGNYKAVSTSQLLGLSESELRYARENIGAGTSNFSGSYNDLTDKPDFSGYITQHQDISNKADRSELFSGNYNDLTNKPDLSVYLTLHQDISNKVNRSELATVATTGNYNDLINKPVIPENIAEFSYIVSSKVDAEPGKGLSTNDYTDADKQKLAGIAAGAQAHIAPTEQEVKSALGVGSGTTKYLREDGTWQIIPDNNTTYDVATTSTDGLMSSTDKAKLDGINTSTLLTQADVPTWVVDNTKPSYIYDEIGYTVTSVTSSGAISLVGTNPLYEVTLDGNASSVSLSTNPSVGHSCHVTFTSTEARTVTIAHDSVNRICPNAEDLILSIPANGYVEIDFLNMNGKIYVRGI